MGVLVGPKKARVWFDFLSPFYDRINPILYTREMRSRLLGEVNGGNVLDVGVGTGYTSSDIDGAVGIDLNLKMLGRAAQRYRGSLILSDALKAPFKKNSFDTIISAGSFHYFPDPLYAMKTFYDLLKPGGVFLGIIPSLRLLSSFVNTFDEDYLRELFRDSGLRLEILEDMRKITFFCKGIKE